MIISIYGYNRGYFDGSLVLLEYLKLFPDLEKTILLNGHYWPE